ncbi:MAG: hypothetical protein K1566_00020 [Candidatus Thiodiazotropha sp. (ex. Lucinisca nassula)]|nr:hypothetical protein [Candidatus Thiodiazotropha sp. (ex. Lucinisca nassula)]
MWQKTLIISIGLMISFFSAPLCLDRFQVSHESPLQILLSFVETEQTNGSELGGKRNA